MKDVEAVLSLDDVGEENYNDEDENVKERPEDWDDDDGRWGRPRAASSQKYCSHNQPPAGCPGPDSGFLKV